MEGSTSHSTSRVRRFTKWLVPVMVLAVVAGFFVGQSKAVDGAIALFDLDRNGVLQQEEVVPFVRPRFNEFDADGDGMMDRGEIAACMRDIFAGMIVHQWRLFGRSEYPDAHDMDMVTMQAALDDMVEVYDLPGAVMLVGKDGVEQFRISSGHFDANMAVPIASAGKWVASAVFMRLVEQGVLDLDAPLDRYVPELGGHWAKTTLRQLLSMSSGAGEGINGLAHLPSTPYKAQFEDLIKYPVHAEPGVEFTYGEGSMQIAGFIAEQASGKRWEQLFDELVATPSGMTNSVYRHGFWHKPGTEINSPNLGGGLYASAQDYFNFLTALMSSGTGDSLLTRTSLTQMESDHTSALVQNFRTVVVLDDWFYGLGVWCEAPIDGRCSRLSSTGSWGALPWIDRQSGTYGVLVTMGFMPELMPFALEVRRMANQLAKQPS